MPDLVTLRILRAIDDTGTVGAAATAVGLSQQAASARIADVERDLGLSLVRRTRQGSSLTDHGRLVVEWSGRLLAEADALALSIRALRADTVAVLAVAASQTLAEAFAPAWMAAFRAATDGAACRLTSGNSAFVVDEVRSGRAAVGLVETPEVPADLGSAPIRTDRLVVVVAPDHPWASLDRPLTARDLTETGLVLREAGSGTRRTLELALSSHTSPDGTPAPLVLAEPAAVLATTGAIRAAVATGIGPSVLSEAAVRDDVARGALATVPVAGLSLERPFTALWKNGVALPAAAETLFAILRASSQGEAVT
ncbi:molybdate transport repressor ModE-like protein [Frondihabitans australicus]|uniref:Molybdate transport repressor ModE-like protein n=1 Tax=Frondihabitans australicus TaxID=386892 RepID=A0A495IIK5_9MICO|nr:molybdate transport repressor ModE-like protein [Frondihabitans australicus]